MKKEKCKQAWESFSNTGAVGAYLTYRAMAEHTMEREEQNPT